MGYDSDESNKQQHAHFTEHCDGGGGGGPLQPGGDPPAPEWDGDLILPPDNDGDDGDDGDQDQGDDNQNPVPEIQPLVILNCPDIELEDGIMKLVNPRRLF